MLIDQLKKEHTQIAEMLSKLKTIDVSSKEGQELLASAHEDLLVHLKKEEDRIYPALSDAAELDEDIKRTMQLCKRDMQVVSKAVSKFFKRYKKGGSGSDFANDFGRLSYAIKSRIGKEETILYELYKQVIAAELKASA
ncbi:MAG TPA: hemerythrin domain-containing protein [Candidatus Aquicultor sp.]|jgi:hemerythrin-like domain-containing protein